MNPMTIDREITVEQPIDKVWAFLSDFRTTEQWDPPTVKTVRTEGDGGVGTVYENTSHILGRDTDITYRVVSCEAPHLLQLQGENDTVSALDTIRISTAGPTTTVRYTAEFSLKGAAKLAAPLAAVGLKKLGDDAAEQMERCLQEL